MARLGGRGQCQGRLSVMKMGKLPASCIRHKARGKRLSAAIDDDADSWEVHAVASKRMRLGPWPPDLHPCSFCSKSFRSAQALGGHIHVHREERMALKARLNAAALAAPTVRQIQRCNETAAAAESSTQKIPGSSPVQAPVDLAAATSTTKIRACSPVDVAAVAAAVAAVGAVEILRPPALSNQESGMAELMTLLGLAPEEPGTTPGFIPPPAPLLKLPLQELVTTSAFIPPPVLNLPLPQSKSSPVVLKHPHSFSATGKFCPPQSLEFPLWQKRSNFPLPQQRRRSLVMPSLPVSIASSAQRTFHPYQRGLVQLGRFSVMASAPLDLELRLGRSSDN